jgi:hypothetical protein
VLIEPRNIDLLCANTRHHEHSVAIQLSVIDPTRPLAGGKASPETSHSSASACNGSAPKLVTTELIGRFRKQP